MRDIITVFHMPGVPQGHWVSPPKSRQSGSTLWKSFANHQSMARARLARRLVLLTRLASAPGKPPCQAPASIASAITGFRTSKCKANRRTNSGPVLSYRDMSGHHVQSKVCAYLFGRPVGALGGAARCVVDIGPLAGRVEGVNPGFY